MKMQFSNKIVDLANFWIIVYLNVIRYCEHIARIVTEWFTQDVDPQVLLELVLRRDASKVLLAISKRVRIEVREEHSVVVVLESVRKCQCVQHLHSLVKLTLQVLVILSRRSLWWWSMFCATSCAYTRCWSRLGAKESGQPLLYV